MKSIITFLAIIGLITIVYSIIGAIVDIKSFDQTKGGYTYPYENWSGSPIDWDSMDANKIGLVKRGYVIDVHVNGTSGMISFEVLRMTFDWQTFSKRALKVHQPRVAFKKRGFNPEF